MTRFGPLLLAALALGAALPGSQVAAQASAVPVSTGAAPVTPAFSAQPRGAELSTAGLLPSPPTPGAAQPGLTRWSDLGALGSGPTFEVSAPAGTEVTLSQVSSTVFALTGVQVSGLGNAGNAALEQDLRADLRALDSLGQSQSRTVQLGVAGRSAAGTELSTRWTEAPAPTGSGRSAVDGDLRPSELQLSQVLLPGGLRGPVQVSSLDPQLAAQYRSAGAPSSFSLLTDAPYGAALSAGGRSSGLSEQPVLPLLRTVLGAAPSLKSWALPDLAGAALPPLEVRRERVYQGQNSRGDHLFQTQGDAQPWRQTVEGAATSAGRSRLTAEVLDTAQMTQAVYRADGLPHSAFEFSTLQLQITAELGAAQVQLTVQVRSTSALRPTGGQAASAPRPQDAAQSQSVPSAVSGEGRTSARLGVVWTGLSTPASSSAGAQANSGRAGPRGGNAGPASRWPSRPSAPQTPVLVGTGSTVTAEQGQGRHLGQVAE